MTNYIVTFTTIITDAKDKDDAAEKAYKAVVDHMTAIEIVEE